MSGERVHIPMVIGGERVETGTTFEAVMPHQRTHVLADVEKGGAAEVERAIAAARAAHPAWSRTPWHERVAVFLRAAELISGPWRSTINAATMLNQSKTAYQAEIDAACETIDFLRYNAEYLVRIYEEQPVSSARRLEPDGVPRARGLRVRDQPVQLHRDRRQPDDVSRDDGQHGRLEARLDPGTLGLDHDADPRGGRAAAGSDQPRLRPRCRDGRSCPREPRARRRPLHGLDRRLPLDLAARSATTSAATGTIRASSARPAARTSSSPILPRIPAPSRPRSSADRSSTRARSARPRRASTSRRTSGARCARRSSSEVGSIGVGDVSDFTNFMGAVIDESSFKTQRDAIAEAKEAGAEIVVGGGVDDSEGWFVEPTVIETDDPGFRLLRDELFGPGRDGVRLRRVEVAGHARARRLDERLRPDRRGLLERPLRDRRGARGASLRRRQLLRERQADRRRRRPAAVRRRARLGHERQGRLDVEPDPLGEPADDQGDARAADGLPLPVPRSRTNDPAGARASLSRVPALPSRCGAHRALPALPAARPLRRARHRRRQPRARACRRPLRASGPQRGRCSSSASSCSGSTSSSPTSSRSASRRCSSSSPWSRSRSSGRAGRAAGSASPTISRCSSPPASRSAASRRSPPQTASSMPTRTRWRSPSRS